MSSVTLPQIADVIKKIDLFSSKESLDELNKSGLLTDLLAAPGYTGVDRKAFRALLGAKTTTDQSAAPLFEEVGRVSIPAISRFSMDEFLTVKDPSFPISYLDPDLITIWGGLIETDIPAGTAVIDRLTRKSRFDNAWNSLTNPEELTFGQIVWMAKNGKFRRDGWSELFKVDSSLIDVYGQDDGWYFRVNPFGLDYGRSAGNHVIFRDSEAPSL